MEKLAIWSEAATVRFAAVDGSDAMTLSAALALFQEVAVSHAENIGVGREAMARAGQVWLLSRMSVQVERRPRYGETVTVRTWPRCWERLFAVRDFDVLDSQGERMIGGRSCWFIIDIDKRRPVRPEIVMEGIPLTATDALPFIPAALGERPAMTAAAQTRAQYNDLDYNGHVNNVSYVRWIENALERGLPERALRSRLDINYMNEVLPDETIALFSGGIEPEAATHPAAPPSFAGAFEGRKAEGGQTAFRAELRLWT